MDVLLGQLEKSVKHLRIIDKVFAEEEHEDKELYLEIRGKIRELNKKNQWLLSDELYVGGKKGGRNSYGRQMILSDIITYIVAGRGYFYATRSRECMAVFIETILHLTNQLMIFDSLAVNVKLRNKVIDELENGIGKDFCKDDERREENQALKEYKGAIGMPLEVFAPSTKVLEILPGKKEALKRLDNWFDSLLPKEVGLWGELIVYAYLLRQKIGYVWPMLLTQELISGDYDNSLKVPDYVIVPFDIKEEVIGVKIGGGKKTHVIGVEVGGGKETQSTRFSNLTGITIATKANADNPKRCPICGKWLLFCPFVIERFSNQNITITNASDPVKCMEECTIYTDKEAIRRGDCPYASVKGVEPKNHVMYLKFAPTIYHFHLKCALKDPKAGEDIADNNIVTYYPYITGLEEIEDLLSEDKAYKIHQLEKTVKALEKELAKYKAAKE
jgi:hypothetical protein